MIIEYEWVNREPFLEYDSYNVEAWLLQLSAKGWLTESGKIARSDEPEAIAYKSQTVEIEKGNLRSSSNPPKSLKFDIFLHFQ